MLKGYRISSSSELFESPKVHSTETSLLSIDSRKLNQGVQVGLGISLGRDDFFCRQRKFLSTKMVVYEIFKINKTILNLSHLFKTILRWGRDENILKNDGNIR